MKPIPNSSRPRRCGGDSAEELQEALNRIVVGQPAAIECVIPYVQMYQANLAPEGRPVGIFLLLGPSGTGKTRTVEALAKVLHGTEKNLLKVDCGEFQMEHEVAKLIGAPPGYLGHRETQPMLTQPRLNAVTSEHSSLSIVLFDEIEKAAASLGRLLLGVLDRAVLRLGDNTSVNFEHSLIFLTSNLGARDMVRELEPDFGFGAMVGGARPDIGGKLESIGMAAVRRKFSPEFVNRIDAVVTYRPLAADSLAAILDIHIEELQQHIGSRLGHRGFQIEISAAAREFLLSQGTSARYGARELKRTMHRHLVQRLAAMVNDHAIEPGATVRVDAGADRILRIEPDNSALELEEPEVPAQAPRRPAAGRGGLRRMGGSGLLRDDWAA